MSTRKMTITVDGVEYDARIATIESTRLGHEDHGIMTAYLDLKLGGSLGALVGGYNYGNFSKGPSSPFGLDQILRIMKVAGVEFWEKVKGCQVIALSKGEYGRIVGLAHLTDEKITLIFETHAEAFYPTKESAA